MKSIGVFSLVCLMIMTVSCGDPAQPETIIKEERIPVVLTMKDLFKGNLISAFLENEEKFIQEANSLFLKGVNSFRNEDDLDSADHYLRMSILKEPTARAYFELGNVNLDKENYEEALNAYGIAEQLNYQPLSKIMYNKSCLYSLKGEEEMAGQYLEYAIQSGYMNIDHISKDSDLQALRETHHYKKAVDKGLRGVTNAENLYWLQFKQMFAKVELPFTVNPISDETEGARDSGYISFDYEKYVAEMRDEQFSREVSKEFYYHTQPYENENYVAVVYVITDIWLGDYAPETYIMATFTHDGKLIDKEKIAGGSELSGTHRLATLNKDQSISIDVMQPEYEKDPDYHGYHENKLIDSKKVGEIVLQIDEKGKISELSSVDLASN